MSTYYCRKCGSATESVSNIPKFCSECSEPFSSKASVSSEIVKPKTPFRPTVIQDKLRNTPKTVLNEEDYDLEEESETEIELPSQDSVEIIGSVDSGIKFEQVINQKPQGILRPQIQVKGKKAKQELKQKLINEFQNEGKQADKNQTYIFGTPGEE